MRVHLLHPGQGSEAAAASTFFSFMPIQCAARGILKAFHGGGTIDKVVSLPAVQRGPFQGRPQFDSQNLGSTTG
jgi:hypothetical protein